MSARSRTMDHVNGAMRVVVEAVATVIEETVTLIEFATGQKPKPNAIVGNQAVTRLCKSALDLCSRHHALPSTRIRTASATALKRDCKTQAIFEQAGAHNDHQAVSQATAEPEQRLTQASHFTNGAAVGPLQPILIKDLLFA